MKRAARTLIALALVGFAAPVLACGFDKHEKSTTTTSAPGAAPAATVTRGEKAKPAKVLKAQKAKAPASEKVATTTY